MADYIRDEEEQVERIREWWQQNGTTLIVTVVLAIAGLIGWRQWQGHQGEQAAQASAQYQQLATGLADGADSSTLQAQANDLIEDYGKTAYADYARLFLAKLAVESGDYDAAQAPLREVAENGRTDELKYTARLRLARVLLQQQAYQEANELLSRRFPAAFQGVALELRGDVAQAQGENELALRSYEQAVSTLKDSAEQDRVQMKLDDLRSAS